MRGAVLVGAFVALAAASGTATSAAPIDPGLTPAAARAQLARRQLERFAPARARGLYVPDAAVVTSGLRMRVRPASEPLGTASRVFDLPGIDGFLGIAGVDAELAGELRRGVVFVGDSRRYSGIPREDLPQDPPGDAIPEPAGALLFAAGFALVALRSRRA